MPVLAQFSSILRAGYASPRCGLWNLNCKEVREVLVDFSPLGLGLGLLRYHLTRCNHLAIHTTKIASRAVLFFCVEGLSFVDWSFVRSKPFGNTLGMNINEDQLFWCSQGYSLLTRPRLVANSCCWATLQGKCAANKDDSDKCVRCRKAGLVVRCVPAELVHVVT